MDGFFVDCIVRKRHPLNVRGLRTWLWTAIDRNLERDRLCATELMMKELAQERASLPPPARGEDETVTAMTPPDGAPRAGKRRAENPELTKEKVPAALEKNAWRHEETARDLGLTDRYALRRLLWKHDLEKPKK